MTLSVVVICWNSLANLRVLLASLPGALKGIESELIVVDNGSTDGTGRFISENYPQALYRRLERNMGVAYARNRGIEMSRGRFVWLLDDDTVINPEATAMLLGHMQNHPQCGIAACRLTDADGNEQQSYKSFPGLGVKVRNMLGINSNPYSEMIARREVFSPCYVIGACQLIRREVIDCVGPLDEHIFYGPEDADFCLRTRAAGWGVDYIPSVSIIHKWKRITNRSPFSAMARRHISALLYFYRKHHRWF